jgi:type I restriction enzyme S subunit
MNAELLLMHFERVSEAPDAVPRLRQFVLDLAVRGKLVEQDSADQPAKELLKRIESEKVRTANGRPHGTRAFPAVATDETPFEVPVGWLWVRIRQITSDRGQTTPTTDFTYIDVTAINKEAGSITEAQIVSAEDAPSRARKVVQEGDVLYSCVRPYLLNIAIVEGSLAQPLIASTAFAVLNGFGLVLPKYLWLVLRSPYMVECVQEKMRGQAYPAINDSDFALLPFPLAPLSEQHRIVARVNELMALCDKLEAAQTERERRRDRVVAASLKKLSDSTDDGEVRSNATFYFQHLPRVTSRSGDIEQLKRTILSLAVRGQLVPQNPQDEPAHVLIERIKAEGEALRKSKGIKPQKPVPPSEHFEFTSVLPPSWARAYLQDIAYLITDGTHLTPRYTDVGRPFLSAQNVKPFRFMPDTYRLVSDSDFEGYRANRKPESGDVLLTRVGAGIGEAAVQDVDFEYAFYVSLCLIKVPTQHLSPDYLVLWLNSPEGRQFSASRTYGKGASQGNLNLSLIRTFSVPVPPYPEQLRIVAKVDQLTAICTGLGEALAASQNNRAHLLEALLRDALDSKEEATA